MERYITSTAGNLNQPIADQVLTLLERDESGVDLDYIYAFVILSVQMFEANMVRARYFSLDSGKREAILDDTVAKAIDSSKKSGFDLMRDLFKDFGANNLAQLEEVYVLRDVITHSHLWEYHLDEQWKSTVSHRVFGGDGKFQRCVVHADGAWTTKLLGLPVVPGYQKRETVVVCFDVLWRALMYAGEAMVGLTNQHRFNVRVSPRAQERGHFGRGVHSVTLKELVDALEKACRSSE